MAENFTFDPKLLSNDDLFNKQMDLTRRKVLAMRLGRGEVAMQIDVMIQAIELERRERMFLDRVSAAPDSPVLIETDPTLREQQQAVEEVKAQEKATQPARPTRRPVRTNNPVYPDGV